MRYIHLVFVSFFLHLNVSAQLEPERVTRKFFPDPDIIFRTPAFVKDDGFTTHSEMMEFLKKIANNHPGLIRWSTAGYTQRGMEIPLVTIKKGNKKNKIRLFYFAGVHGNEPAGIDALLLFIEKMAEDPSLILLLDKLEFYILPMLNCDGVSDFSRLSANGININRDMITLDTPEATVLHAIMNKVNPHITVDFHEFGPYHERYSAISPIKMMIPWDVMFLFSCNPNITKELRNIVAEPFLSDAVTEIEKHGLTHHTYYASSMTPQGISFMQGNNSPNLTVTSLALRNTISLLVETRGIGLGRASLRRRVLAAYILSVSIAKTSYHNTPLIRNTLTKSKKSKDDIVLNYSTKKTKMELPFINVEDNEIERKIVAADLACQVTPEEKQAIPQAYILLPEQKKIVELLKKMGTKVTVLKEEKKMEVQCFLVRDIGQTVADSILDKQIVFNTEKKNVTFPPGTYYIPTTQKNGRLLNVLLEPESIDGWIYQGVIKAKKGEYLPVYKRINKRAH